MSKNRYLNTSFWDDSFIINCDPIEKLLFLYCLTNPLTSICGIYEISLKRIAFDTGIDKEMILKIFERFEKADKIKYENGWIALKNFTNHQKCSDNPEDNINKGIEKALLKVPENLKIWINLNTKLIKYNSNTNINGKQESKGLEGAYVEEIINYLNEKTNKAYRKDSDKTKRFIEARLNEKFTLDDFKKVIDIKCGQWLKDAKMSAYLRPETLFGTKFESYLNEKFTQPAENTEREKEEIKPSAESVRKFKEAFGEK